MMNTNSLPPNISPLHHHHDLPAPKPFRKTLRRSTRLLNLEQAAGRKDFDGDNMIDDEVSIGIGELSGLGLSVNARGGKGKARGNRYSIMESGIDSSGDSSGSITSSSISTGNISNGSISTNASSFSLKRPHPSSTDINSSSPISSFQTKSKILSRNAFEHDISLTQSTSTPILPTSSTPAAPQYIPPIWSHQIKRRDSLDQLFSPTSPFAGLGQSTLAGGANNTSTPISFNLINPYTTSPSPSPIPASKSHHVHIQPHHELHPPLPRPSQQIHRLKPKFNPSVTAEFSDYHTPENYRSVKPLQTAFMSTGLLSKRNRMNNIHSSEGFRMPPDTPCKKPSNTSLPLISHNSMFGTPSSTPSSYTPNSSNIGGGFGNTTSGRRRSNLGLHDSLLRFSVDFGNTSTQAAEDSPMSDDVEIINQPETPTKETNHMNDYMNIGGTNNGVGSFSIPMNMNTTLEETNEKQQLSTTPQSRISRWTDGSSTEHKTSSPRTPDVVMNSSNEVGNESATSHTSHQSIPMIRRTTSTTNLVTVQEPPRTPAKTPKTPIDPLMNGPTFLSLRKSSIDIDDPVLTERFDNVSLVGRGEFSVVYSLSIRRGDNASPSSVHSTTIQENRFAVKRTRFPFMGPKARHRRLEEVEILRSLTTTNPLNGHNEEEGRDYVLMLLDAWEANGYLYIMTEFCENGSLDTFLSERGNVSRLDEWRVWKILVEIALVSNTLRAKRGATGPGSARPPEAKNRKY